MARNTDKSAASASSPTSNPAERVVVIANDGFGLYFGRIIASDEEWSRTKCLRVTRARHIAYWKGDPGGITSLAATGPQKGSRIGKECPAAFLTGVKNVYECSAEAAARFDDLAASAG